MNKLFISFISLLILSLSCSSFAAETYRTTNLKKNDLLKVRKGAGTDFKDFYNLWPRQGGIQIISEQPTLIGKAEWVKIRVEQFSSGREIIEGWVNKHYLENEDIKITYSEIRNPPTASNQPPYVLKAKIKGKEIEVSRLDHLAIKDQRDFDGDGITDVIFCSIPGGGGNCCSCEYYIASYEGSEKFSIHPITSSGKSPTFEKWNKKWSAKFISDNEGSNTADYQEIRTRYIFKKGKPILVGMQQDEELDAIKEFRSKEFTEDEEKTLEYDLDGDGKQDAIKGKVWKRWGRIVFSVDLSSGQTSPASSFGCKRLGVYKTKTAGIHDLICDTVNILKWNGKEYK